MLLTSIQTITNLQTCLLTLCLSLSGVQVDSIGTPLGLHLDYWDHLDSTGIHLDSEQSDWSPMGRVGECKVQNLFFVSIFFLVKTNFLLFFYRFQFCYDNQPQTMRPATTNNHRKPLLAGWKQGATVGHSEQEGKGMATMTTMTITT